MDFLLLCYKHDVSEAMRVIPHRDVFLGVTDEPINTLHTEAVKRNKKSRAKEDTVK